MRRRQLSLFESLPTQSLEHGGDVGSGKRKGARPFSRRQSNHIVFRSSAARGSWSLRRRANEERIEALLQEMQAKFGVKVYEYAITGTHIHLLARASSRKGLSGFLSAFAGTVARIVTGAAKGNPTGTFWDALTYSRIVSWGRDFHSVRRYIEWNRLETMGLIPFAPRKERRGHSEATGPPASSI
jgi:REP element-mobilizing transposase RayT